MRKIPTVLVRDPDDRAHVLMEVTPGCEWVLAGEGVPTRKYDGTCTMLDADGCWWARREVRKGKATPPHFVREDFDGVTGKTQGWEPVEQSPFARFHEEALDFAEYASGFPPGTYELIGPKINGNPERSPHHLLIAHAEAEPFPNHGNPPGWQMVFDIVTMCRLGERRGWEGIVWHHPDGRMAKLKARDLRDGQ